MDDIANFDSSTTEASSASTDHKTVATTASPYNITRPRIELRTGPEERRLTLPGGNLSKRPEPLRFVSTPPDSPTRTRAYTMGSSARDNAAVTPPPTPTTPSRPKYDSASTFLSPSPSVRTGDATSSPHATLTRPRRDTAASLEDREKPEAGSTELLWFTYWLSDYEIETKENGKKKLIGSGVWSDVFLAKPCLPKPGALEQAAAVAAAGPKSTMTPPITPVRTRNSSLSSLSKEKLSQVLPQVPPQYAIKVPASRSAKTVLGEEARIISYLSRFPDAEKHIVPFYGQDARTDALVLKAMDCTLETWIQNELNTHNEAARARELARVFPSIAIKLIRGLIWMQEKGCIHADIKPSNVLISAPTDPLNPSVPGTVYSDFSSTILTLPTATQDLTADANAASESKPPAPLGGGTWDFLDPLLLGKPSAPVSPTPTTDLWSLAITLLFIVIGASPYDSFRGNKYQQREMIKQGAPLSCLAHGDEGARNLARAEGLSRALGWDVRGWFAKVLRRDGAARVSVKEWREEIEGVAGKNRMKI